MKQPDLSLLIFRALAAGTALLQLRQLANRHIMNAAVLLQSVTSSDRDASFEVSLTMMIAMVIAMRLSRPAVCLSIRTDATKAISIIDLTISDAKLERSCARTLVTQGQVGFSNAFQHAHPSVLLEGWHAMSCKLYNQSSPEPRTSFPSCLADYKPFACGSQYLQHKRKLHSGARC